MKISELIEELNRLKDEHGDLEVKYYDSLNDEDKDIRICEKYESDKFIIIYD